MPKKWGHKLFGVCPGQCVDILTICDKTKFFEKPNYERIYGLMAEAMKETEAKVEYFFRTKYVVNKLDEFLKTSISF